MRLEAIRQNQTGTPALFPSPSSGVDESVPVTAMKSNTALRLINAIPTPEGITSRRGSVTWGQVPGGAIEALLSWSDKKQFACTRQGIYEVQHNVITPHQTATFSSGRWLGTSISNPGGTFMVVANGFDGVKAFDGRSWTACMVEGPSYPERLACPVWHNHRVWFFERTTMNLWYLDTGAFGGLAKPFPVRGNFPKGGEIVGLASRKGEDKGANIGDQLVIATSEGQVAIYSGHDPARSDTFALAGVWDTAKPVGWRPLSVVGGEAVLLTVSGLMTVPRSLLAGKTEEDEAAISFPMQRTYAHHALFPKSPDWQVLDVSANKGGVIINAADGRQMFKSAYGWCEFRDLNATAWLETSNGAFFGTADGAVKRYDFAHDDDGKPISSEVIHAYSVLGSSKIKRATRVRPNFTAPPMNPRFTVLADYQEPSDRYEAQSATEGGVLLDVPFSKTAWAEPKLITRWGWRTTHGRGHALALGVSWKSKGPVVYRGSTVLVAAGGAT